jgi:hypothetical protein
MEFKPKILSYCFLKRYKDYIGEFGHNSQKLSELLLTLQRHLIFSHVLSFICPFHHAHTVLDQDG